MKWLTKLDIAPRLAVGFGGVLVLTLIFGTLALSLMKRLEEQTSLLYRHPFAVTHAVDEVEIHVLKIHREMKDLVHSRNSQGIARHLKRVEQFEARAFESLATIEERFLGDIQEVGHLRQALIDWRPIRQEVMGLGREGSHEAADSITRGKGAAQADLIEDELADLRECAVDKAAESIARAKSLQRRGIFLTVISLVAVFLVSTVLAVSISRSIRVPLETLNQLAEQVSGGDYDHQATIHSRDDLGRLSTVFNEMVTSIRRQSREIERKNEENERLLLNILPGPIVERLKQGERRIADHFPEVTVLFADLVGFTPMSSRIEPGELVSLLDGLFSSFDELAERHGIEKIKTIGDAYMATAGLTYPLADPAGAMVEMGLEMIAATRAAREESGVDLRVRVGIHSGPVVAGIIGKSKFIYDLWGETVNFASRMESHGVVDRVQISTAIKEKVEDAFLLDPRGLIDVKGQGEVEVWLVKGRASTSSDSTIALTRSTGGSSLETPLVAFPEGRHLTL